MKTFKDYLRETSESEKERFFVGKDLTYKEALKVGKKFKLKYDHRGVNYNPNSGYITYL